MEAVPVRADVEQVGSDGRPAANAPRRARPAWVAPALAGAAGLGACLAVVAINPVTDGNPQICPFKILTGLDCPGCGATRAANALLRGHLGAAVDHNLLFVVLLPVALIAYASWALRSVGVSVPSVRVSKRWLPALIVVVLLFWGLRLLPGEPFSWLGSGLD